MKALNLALTLMLAVTLQACNNDSDNTDQPTADDQPPVTTTDENFAAERSLVIEQAAPSLVTIDIGQTGGTHGDVIAFDAPINSANGLSGKLSGIITTVDIVESDDVFQDRIAELVFDFPDVGTLVVGGKSVYPFDGSGSEEMTINNPQTRAVLGGTGEFLGALGQVETTRNEDLTYRHSFDLVGLSQWSAADPAPAEQQTFILNQGVASTVYVDLGQEAGSHGDLLAFAAPLTSEEGLAGTHSGMIVTVDIPEPDEATFQDRMVKSVFDFGQGTTLMMLGRSGYLAEANDVDERAVNEPVTTPIVGGTGDLVGARGQVITTRQEDGTYTQEFQLVGMTLPDAAGMAEESTLILDQALPFLAHVDVGGEGSSHGDVLAFDAEVTSQDGLLGKLSGLITTVTIPEPGDLAFKDRIAHIVFDFGSANTVVVGGKSRYPFDGSAISEFEKRVPQVRSIIGGTGNFSAAQGQVTTTRNDDGDYTHALRFTGTWQPGM